jgi:hypothetical protein
MTFPAKIYTFYYNYQWKFKGELREDVVDMLKLYGNYEEISKTLDGIFFADLKRER